MRKLQTILVILIIFVIMATSCTPKATSTTVAPTAVPPTKVVPPTNTPIAIVQTKATETPVPTAVPQIVYKQAPMLDADVSSGKLPKVEERLPKDISVITPRESIGKYGGTLFTASWWPQWGNVKLYFATDAPIKWKEDLTGYEPGLFKGYEWSEDGKTFTMHMREGLKWSDGVPYTSADWKFWWEDIANNNDYKANGGGSIPSYMRNKDGTPITLEFPDDYTVVWKSTDRPLWIDPYFLAQGTWEFADPKMKPAHYLKPYHPKYDPTKTYDDLAKIDQWYNTPGYPCLFAWCLAEVSADAVTFKLARNPYFWRVDTEGNQLPYIDYINIEIVSDEQVRILNCTQGKYDTAFRICGGPNEIPLITEQATKVGIHQLKGWMNGAGAWPGYMVNEYYVEGGKNYTDDTPEHAKEIRDLLRDSRFRKALSWGFDRNRVIAVAWNGFGEAKAATISPQSWHFAGAAGQEVYKKWAAADAQFDAAAANKALDELGMTKGTDGFRMLPSGKEFILRIDVTDWGGSLKVQVDSATEMKNQWETNLAIKVEVNNIQGQPDVDTRTNEGYYMLRGAHISEIDILTYPDWLFPVVNRYIFPLEGRWFEKGGTTCKPTEGQPYSCGVQPAAGSPAQILQDLYNKARTTGTVEGRHQVVWEAIDEIIKDGPFVIGVSGDQPMPIFVKDYMHNILDYGVVGPWAPATPGNQIASQWWMDPH